MNSMKTHELKILPQYFKEVVNGNKTFEIRENDRGFEVGDKLILKEYVLFDDGVIKGEYGLYTGNETKKEVSYIYEGEEYGLKKGWCVLGLKNTEPQKVYVHISEVKGLEGIPMPKVFSDYGKLTDFEREIESNENIKVLNITVCIVDKKLESESK